MQFGGKSIITSEQIRAARYGLRWTFETLSKNCHVSVRTLKTLETQMGVPNCRTVTLEKVQLAFEMAGIEFIGTPDDRPGIRIRTQDKNI